MTYSLVAVAGAFLGWLYGIGWLDDTADALGFWWAGWCCDRLGHRMQGHVVRQPDGRNLAFAVCDGCSDWRSV